MEWNTRTLGLIAAGLLVIVGVVLLFVTEPAGGEGSDPSFGTADVSEETRPYLWHGIALIVVGLIVGGVFWVRDGSSGSSG